MYDRKTVRRRRAVLGLLVAGALILLTAYFGESSSGGLHSAQRGVFSIVAPIQDGASRVLKPFRDLVNWVGDTIDAKGEVADLRKERDEYRLQRVQYNTAINESRRLQSLLDMDAQVPGFDQYGPVTGRVIGASPTAWSLRIEMNVGTGDGVHSNMPVMSSGGLVGLVTAAGSNASIVKLVTSGDLTVSVEVAKPVPGGHPVQGYAKAVVGSPNDIVMTGASNKGIVRIGDLVVTSGTVGGSVSDPSLYPQGIPVGRVFRVDDAGGDQQEIHLHPAADVRNLSEAQVLTKVNR